MFTFAICVLLLDFDELHNVLRLCIEHSTVDNPLYTPTLHIKSPLHYYIMQRAVNPKIDIHNHIYLELTVEAKFIPTNPFRVTPMGVEAERYVYLM